MTPRYGYAVCCSMPKFNTVPTPAGPVLETPRVNQYPCGTLHGPALTPGSTTSQAHGSPAFGMDSHSALPVVMLALAASTTGSLLWMGTPFNQMYWTKLEILLVTKSRTCPSADFRQIVLDCQVCELMAFEYLIGLRMSRNFVYYVN